MSDQVPVVRFVLVLLVIANHVGFDFSFDRDGLYDKAVNESFLLNFTSPLFAAISGCLFFLNSKNGFSLNSKLRNRLKSLVVPYFLWSLIYIVLFYVIKRCAFALLGKKFWVSADPELTIKYFFTALLETPIVPSFWFLQNLIVISFLSPLVYFVLRKRFLFYLVLVSILISLHCSLPIYFSDRFIQYYLLGAWIGYNQISFGFVWCRNKIISLLSLVLLVFIDFLARKNQYGLFFSFILTPAIGVLAFDVVRNFGKTQVVMSLWKYQAYSFFIFASHGLIIAVLNKTMVAFLPVKLFTERSSNFGLMILEYLITVIAVVSLAVGFKKAFPKLYEILVGYRENSIGKSRESKSLA